MAENGLKRDGGMQRTHQQQENGVPDGVSAQHSHRQTVFPAQQLCESPPPCPSSPGNAAAVQVMGGNVELHEFMKQHNLAMVQLIQQQNEDFSQMMVPLQETFFRWCVESVSLTGYMETLPVESTSCDDLVSEEGEKLRYECERLLTPQYVGKIGPWSLEVDTAQLGMECSYMEPFATERGKQGEVNNEEDTVRRQLERSQVESIEIPRQLEDAARIVNVSTDEPWIGSRSLLQDELGGHGASSKRDNNEQLVDAEALSGRRQASEGFLLRNWSSSRSSAAKKKSSLAKIPCAGGAGMCRDSFYTTTEQFKS